MKRIGLMGTVLAAMVFSTMALGFDAYFSDASGKWLGKVWEGQYVYIAVKDPEKGACGIDQFQADLIIFDFKTGATLKTSEQWSVVDHYIPGAWFRELGGIGSGLYFWVEGPGSNTKVRVQIGSRDCFADPAFTDFCRGNTHVLGDVSPWQIRLGPDAVPFEVDWWEGAWEYLDEDVTGNGADLTGVAALPKRRATARVDLYNEKFFSGVRYMDIAVHDGRFENMDTLVLIVRDKTDERNIDQDQVKIIDTVVKLTVTPAVVEYGCGPACTNIVVRIEDPDENLNCNEVEYVPFFVIINPGSWNPVQSAPATNFCQLMMTGGVLFDPEDPSSTDVPLEPIRWYNIYEPGRGISYGNAAWWNPNWTSLDGAGLLQVVFFAAETAVDSGVFELNFGNLEDFQAALGLARTDRLPTGTTIAFYYIDPNDFDDMDLATINVITNKYLSKVEITDANGIPVSEVKIGHGGLYIRVLDADANDNACCQDNVVVHICDPHNEDDSEYVVIDEISNNSGIFFTQSGIRLEPVWDAVNGYQLVFDDWNVQAFNEDTIFVRYNSVEYYQEFLNLLGDGNPNAGGGFPPAIKDGMNWENIAGESLTDYVDSDKVEEAGRNQYWDVSFDKVKVYDFQVFDGVTHCMKFLDGTYQPVTEISVAGNLYIEVCDYDQNENPLLRELIFGGWNKDSDPYELVEEVALSPELLDGAGTDDFCDDEHSEPIWGTTCTDMADAGEFSVMANGSSPSHSILEVAGLLQPTSISGIGKTVKIFMFNAQKGTWERLDLRETGVGTGIFRSTVCVAVGEDGLKSSSGDTIMAFYQDPSNHSDVSIISIKVSMGGAIGVTPPVVALKVEFDRTTYYPGDTVTITVTDEQYAGAAEIVGTDVLVLLDKDNQKITSWNKLDAVAGQPGKFRVTYVLPETVKLGTITAKYTDPYVTTRVAQGQATVVAKALQNVTGITVSPNPFKTSTTFTIQAEPTGAVAQKITITVYDLTGAKVATIEGANTASVTWTGGNLRNGAYIYVAVVEGAGKVFGPFKNFVYIER